MHTLLIYGGTFDPIHFGHIHTALNVQKQFHFETFAFLPCKLPVLKDARVARADHRLAMMRLALAPFSASNAFTIDLAEIERPTPSYMIETLRHFRKQYGNLTAITLLMGIDAFNQLPQWHEWSKLLTLANILVIKREGFKEAAPCEPIQTLLKQHKTDDWKAITKKTHGVIYFFDAGRFDVSSSWLRKQLAERKCVDDYLPSEVVEYIKQQGLYSAPKQAR
ncbi:MAG: nicotinate-nucleotide adenylyltransferase [Tatlockia sp.]|jgi:nicotinate-nucleotide adenylyltransferase